MKYDVRFNLELMEGNCEGGQAPELNKARKIKYYDDNNTWVIRKQNQIMYQRMQKTRKPKLLDRGFRIAAHCFIVIGKALIADQ